MASKISEFVRQAHIATGIARRRRKASRQLEQYERSTQHPVSIYSNCRLHTSYHSSSDSSRQWSTDLRMVPRQVTSWMEAAFCDSQLTLKLVNIPWEQAPSVTSDCSRQLSYWQMMPVVGVIAVDCTVGMGYDDIALQFVLLPGESCPRHCQSSINEVV